MPANLSELERAELSRAARNAYDMIQAGDKVDTTAADLKTMLNVATKLQTTADKPGVYYDLALCMRAAVLYGHRWKMQSEANDAAHRTQLADERIYTVKAMQMWLLVMLFSGILIAFILFVVRH